jgi:hypothetical protein
MSRCFSCPFLHNEVMRKLDFRVALGSQHKERGDERKDSKSGAWLLSCQGASWRIR